MLGRIAAFNPAWRGRLSELAQRHLLTRLPLWVNLLLVLLLAYTAAQFTWQLASPPTAPVIQRQEAVAAPPGQPQSNHPLRQVAALHLFGVPQQAAQPARRGPIEAPDTRLKLALRGVMASSRQETALAIIADPGGREERYRVGATLPGGAALHEIYADRVILERGGRLETLRLPKERLPSAAGVEPTLPGSEPDMDLGIEGVPGDDVPPPMPEEQPAAGSGASPGQQLREIRQALVQSPEQVWQQVRILPVMGDGGAIKGYTLTHNDRQLMDALGLRDSDIITAVNGMALSDPSALYQIMGELSSANQLTLSIERDGQAQSLSVRLE